MLIKHNPGSINDEFFTDPNWRQFATDVLKAKGAYPNRLYSNKSQNSGAMVAFRGASDSWAVNKAAVDYLINAVQQGRIGEGYAILAEGKPPAVVSSLTINELAKLLKDVPPTAGTWGPYWWIPRGFAIGPSADTPF